MTTHVRCATQCSTRIFALWLFACHTAMAGGQQSSKNGSSPVEFPQEQLQALIGTNGIAQCLPRVWRDLRSRLPSRSVVESIRTIRTWNLTEIPPPYGLDFIWHSRAGFADATVDAQPGGGGFGGRASSAIRQRFLLADAAVSCGGLPYDVSVECVFEEDRPDAGYAMRVIATTHPSMLVRDFDVAGPREHDPVVRTVLRTDQYKERTKEYGIVESLEVGYQGCTNVPAPWGTNGFFVDVTLRSALSEARCILRFILEDRTSPHGGYRAVLRASATPMKSEKIGPAGELGEAKGQTFE
jgi:hypothetical protein